MSLVSVVIPAFNEEKCIRQTLEAVKSIKSVKEIIVVDDGSTDKTAEIAANQGVYVIRLSKNLGKGKALNLGCLECQCDYIALIDADLESSASELEKLINPVVNGEADMTIAVFPKTNKKAGFGLVKGLANLGIMAFGGKKFSAPLSGQRVMNKNVFIEVFPFADGFGIEVISTIKALRKGFKIKEVKTNMQHRVTGRSLTDFKHRGRQFLDVFSALFKLRFSRG